MIVTILSATNRFFKQLVAMRPQLALGVAMAVMPLLAYAEEAEAEHGMPNSVYLQVINFVLYAGLLFFFMRRPVTKYFQDREQAFRQALIKAANAKKEAEQQKKDIETRLTALQTGSAESIAAARREAEELRKRMLLEAESLAANLRNEAKRAADFEIQRAQNELREQLLNESVAMATKILTEKMAEQDQKRLQSEFVDKIQVVHT
jgi:F-type H+-transporting ATPase subunit b